MSATAARARRWWTLALGAVLTAWAFGPLIYISAGIRGPGSHITGADGPFPGDQLQYMAFVRDGSHRLLVGNLYDLTPTRGIFLHPMFAVSSGVLWLTDSIQVAFLLWKPVAIAVVVIGAVTYARRLIDGPAWAVGAATAIGVFFATPSGSLMHALRVDAPDVDQMGAVGQLAVLTWGYLPAAIAVALIPLYIVWMERIVDPERRPQGISVARATAVASCCGLLASWLHPWQGSTILLLTFGVVVARRRADWLRALAIPMVVTLLPLLYYKLLALVSSPWGLAQKVNTFGPGPLWAFAAVMFPLAAPALLGVRRLSRDADVAEWSLVLWPGAAITEFLFYHQVPGHFVEGIGMPLGVLAVRACLRLPGRAALAAGAVALAVLIVPGSLRTAVDMRRLIDRELQPFVLTGDEQRAMSYLESSTRQGGVLANAYLGSAVPAFTGRGTFVGHPNWTPDFANRARIADALLVRSMDPGDASQIVKTYRPAFLLARCGEVAPLETELGPMVREIRRFGCTTVYEVDPSAS